MADSVPAKEWRLEVINQSGEPIFNICISSKSEGGEPQEGERREAHAITAASVGGLFFAGSVTAPSCWVASREATLV